MRHRVPHTAVLLLMLAGMGNGFAEEAPDAPYPHQNMVMRAAVQKYPELVGEPHDGTYNLEIVLRAEGSIYDSKLSFLTESRIQNSLLPIAPMRDALRGMSGNGRVVIDQGQALADVGEASGEIHAMWLILPEGYDESRNAGRVNDVVVATHYDYMLPTRDELEPDRVYTNVNVLTVFMTEDGQIAREAVESITIKSLLAMTPRPLSPRGLIARVLVPTPVAVEAFQVLGLDAEQIGQTGEIVVQPAIGGSTAEELSADENKRAIRFALDTMRFQPLVLVRYAWPRRPGEPSGGSLQPQPTP
jgi:hypothetical protein